MSYESFLVIQFSLTPAYIILLMLLFQSIYRIYLSTYNRFITFSMLLMILIIALIRDQDYNYSAGVIVNIISALIAVPFFVLMIKKLYSLKPDKFLRLNA